MQKWEYINFAQLIPFCEGEELDPFDRARYVLFPGMEAQPGEGRHQEYSFDQWAACFVLYMAAMATKFPDSTPELCAYFYNILRCKMEFQGGMWRHYDRQFRKRAAATGNRKWSQIDWDLNAKCFTGRAREMEPCTLCGSLKHPTASCQRRSKLGDKQHPSTQVQIGLKRPRADASAPLQCCYDYNVRRCNRKFRKFYHACLKCHGQHPLVECSGQMRTTSRDNPTKGAKMV